MTAKEYLERPERIVREIRRKQERIGTLKRLATRFGPELSDIRVQTTHDPTKMQGFLADAADEEKEIARLEKLAWAEKQPKRKMELARQARELRAEIDRLM